MSSILYYHMNNFPLLKMWSTSRKTQCLLFFMFEMYLSSMCVVQRLGKHFFVSIEIFISIWNSMRVMSLYHWMKFIKRIYLQLMNILLNWNDDMLNWSVWYKMWYVVERFLNQFILYISCKLGTKCGECKSGERWTIPRNSKCYACHASEVRRTT